MVHHTFCPRRPAHGAGNLNLQLYLLENRSYKLIVYQVPDLQLRLHYENLVSSHQGTPLPNKPHLGVYGSARMILEGALCVPKVLRDTRPRRPIVTRARARRPSSKPWQQGYCVNP
jgi:hypothetical protein